MDRGPWRKQARCREQLDRESEALRLLGPASVSLLSVDGDVLVLDRVCPGTAVADLPDDEATVALAKALQSLWVPVPDGCQLPTVADECRPLYSTAVAPLPQDMVSAARHAFERLMAEPTDICVLHGDLHHDNLLWSEQDGWVAIDPHGLVGPRGYDVGPMLINPWDGQPARLLDRRLEVLSEVLDLPPSQLAAWGLVRAVLSEAWMVEDTGHIDAGPLQVARALAVRLTAGDIAG